MSIEQIFGNSSIDPRGQYSTAKERQNDLLNDAIRYGKTQSGTEDKGNKSEGKTHTSLVGKLRTGFAALVLAAIFSGPVQTVEAQSGYMDNGNPPVMRHDVGIDGGASQDAQKGGLSPLIDTGRMEQRPNFAPSVPVVTQGP